VIKNLTEETAHKGSYLDQEDKDINEQRWVQLHAISHV